MKRERFDDLMQQAGRRRLTAAEITALRRAFRQGEKAIDAQKAAAASATETELLGGETGVDEN